MLLLTRPARLLLAFGLTVLTVLAWTWVRTMPEYAADDQIDRAIAAKSCSQRGAQCNETIVWRLGTTQGEMDRAYFIYANLRREQGRGYTLTNIRSPVPKEGCNSSPYDSEAKDGREGQAQATDRAPTRPLGANALCHLNELPGQCAPSALHESSGMPRFREPRIARPRSAEVPGGADASASTDLPQSTTKCQQVDFAEAVPPLRQSDIPPVRGFDRGKSTPGLVADNRPTGPDGSKAASAKGPRRSPWRGSAGSVLVGSPAGCCGGQERPDSAMPARPGTTPRPPECPGVPRSDFAFGGVHTTPDPGVLGRAAIDGQVDTASGGTIIDLAVRGPSRCKQDPMSSGSSSRPERAAHRRDVLLTSLFEGRPPGAREACRPGQPLDAPPRCGTRCATRSRHAVVSQVPSATATAVRVRAIALDVSGLRATEPGCCGAVPCCQFHHGGGDPVQAPAWSRTAEAARSATSGGFQDYLATGRGRPLRFEEGEDIFSKYLPGIVLN